jgi:hypothetical protein
MMRSVETTEMSQDTRGMNEILLTQMSGPRNSNNVTTVFHVQNCYQRCSATGEPKESGYFFYLREQTFSVLTQSYTHKKVQSETLHAFSI